MTRSVVVLCGPPGVGKSTAARDSGLMVFDRDDPEWSSEKEFRTAIGRLRMDLQARAVVIRSGATTSARRSAALLVGATQVFLLLAEPAELKRRIVERRRADFVRGTASVQRWFDRFDRADGVPDFPGWADAAGGMPVGMTSRMW